MFVNTSTTVDGLGLKGRMSDSDIAAIHATATTHASELLAAAAGDSAGASAQLRVALSRTQRLKGEHGDDLRFLASKNAEELGVAHMTPASLSAVGLPVDTPDARRDSGLLMDWATHGLTLDTSADFVASSSRSGRDKYPKVRSLAQRVAPAILSLVASLVSSGGALVFPRDEARNWPLYHAHPIHWVPKPTDVLGRLVTDASAGDESLNGGPDLKMHAAGKYGKIECTRETEAAAYLLEHRAKMRSPRLNGGDVRRAFRHILLSSRSAALSCMEVQLDDGQWISVVQVVMWFGGTVCPYAYMVVSRTIDRLLAREGMPSISYIDDIAQAAEEEACGDFLERTKSCVCALLSPGTEQAWAVNKQEEGLESLIFIGWEWNIVCATVSLIPRAVIRCLTRLLGIQGQESAPVRELQAVASWASRLSMIMPSLKPLSVYLYAPLIGKTQLSATVSLSQATRSVVDVWIAVLRRAFNDNVGWAVPLERLVWKSPIISVQFDGSPDGAGAVVPAIDECGHRVEAWAALEFDCGMTSSHQNASEYIAATFGVALLVSLGYRNCGVRFVGDSRTVLNWIGKQSARSELALRAAVLCGALMRAAGLVVSEAWWLSSADNSIPDDISRRKYGHAVLREVSRNPWSQSWEDRAWALVNPTVDQNFDSFDWLAVLQEADDLAGELVNVMKGD